MIVAVAAGLVVGALVGLLGGGGSVLAVPALVYAADQDVSQAVATSLLVVGITAVVALLPRVRAGRIAWRIALLFGAAGAATAFAGAAVNRLLPGEVVLALFAGLMVGAGVRMLREKPATGAACAVEDGRVDWRRCAPRTVAGGLAVGFLTGLLGVGGGFLIIPVLVIVLGLPMTTAIGTSLVVIALNSAAGFAAHAGEVTLDVPVTSAFSVAAVGAALAAGRVGSRLDTARLRRWFAYLVFAVAALVLAQLGTAAIAA
ncbi:sulfite exporter TauE/SafE family protein [Geodermatophilus sp. YIM 151500]|uniref:sulfite exporter TauE/SafE family protein n=1 Tax=Geodermatophilus sp. YIM 151500 TaxID=2984531 RepID=UPI0021E376A6|nr:sulfite exporter TauE/SafE family protein [Geodermatophilus sp. YIM 151500]MCV2488555.1 sulfite exporter TauE/SafE family protein [Geodermatophilus sp. YIM 151500]